MRRRAKTHSSNVHKDFSLNIFLETFARVGFINALLFVWPRADAICACNQWFCSNVK